MLKIELQLSESRRLEIQLEIIIPTLVVEGQGFELRKRNINLGVPIIKAHNLISVVVLLILES